MIHVVTGDSATAALKKALQHRNDQIIGLPIDFSTGPINCIQEEKGIELRNRWITSSFNSLKKQSKNQQSIYERSLKDLLDIENGQEATLWTCENASEQTGLRIACFLLAGKQLKMNIVNTQQAVAVSTKDIDMHISIRHTGECNANQLLHFYKYSSSLLTEEKRTAFEQDAEKLLLSTSIVRSWCDSKILDEPETRDDVFIMERIRNNHRDCPKSEYIDAIRIIGEVLSLSEQPLSDSWIDYRIRFLIQNGQLAYKGNLQSMQTYKIKKFH
ncbi:DUF1835 domain-containing protein [Planococcus sp. CPCC 101016]|uniref:DUF1835 domain-containing protein n=1 Tax=Planococcus sp. CPCC 101016 TaxID=2599617 RepID=UPI0011B770EF|nr:DUF1835 domain-containing protein [Planococcus sp. CPCC 101016]TWT07976.1 DUF1835 domain-containing protein [Planococcus sp. CPCC 101016]